MSTLRSSRWAAPSVALLGSAVVACLLGSCDAQAADSSCVPPFGASGADLRGLKQRSCAKVEEASEQLPALMARQGQELRDMWANRSAEASRQCKDANASGLLNGAALALAAWGDTIMDGRECCNRLQPPFCVTVHESRVTHLAPFAAFLLAGLVILLSPFCFKQLTAPSFFVREGPPPLAPVAAAAAKRKAVAAARALATGASAATAATATTAPADARGDQARRLRRNLEEAFMGTADVERGGHGREGVRASPLRVLPGAAGWASTAADLFVFLWRVFDFQPDSVQNQFEHLLSLWRSHAAMVADRASEGKQLPRSGPASENELLKTALEELHAELLEGFCLWRDKLRGCSEAGAAERRALPLQLAGATWPSADPARVPGAQELAEVSVFLLVWGEAGNIRFMPEVLYLLTELVLAAASSPQGRSLPPHPGGTGSAPSSAGSEGTRSPGFLTHVIRPIYNMVFDESHERVGIDVPLVEIKWATSSQPDGFRLLTCRVTDPSNRPGSSYKAEVRLEKPHGQRDRERFPASQQWLLDPVGYSPEGQRLFRIRWAADRSRCLEISAWSSRTGAEGRQVQLSEADEGDDGQVFVHDVAAERLVWQEEVVSADSLSSTRRLFRLGAAGHEGAEHMRVQLQEIVGSGLNHGGQALKVEVKEKRSGKDAKQLRKGFESFFPPDAANYDDWNEIFCQPKLLAKRLVLSTGDRLFDLPHGQRFSALHQVNWRASLAGVKTHRELHSYWGAFASTHRVWLLHELFYFTLVCLVTTREGFQESDDPNSAVVGGSPAACFAAAGLVVPFHAALWHFACWCTSGPVIRERRSLLKRTAVALGNTVLWSLPIVTFALVRLCQARGNSLCGVGLAPLLALHFAGVACGAALLLLAPARAEDQYWPLSYAPFSLRIARWVFWILVLGAKVAFGVFLLTVLSDANRNLLLPGLLRTSLADVRAFAFTPQWDREVIEWFALWGTGFMLFLTDTQLWFTIGCTFAGAAVGLAQRQWAAGQIALEDAIAKIPERFSRKVLAYDHAPGGRARETGPFSPHFPVLWDRIIEYMRYEDKVDDTTAGELTFQPRGGGADWASLSERLPERPQGTLTVPRLFNFGRQTCTERYLRRDLMLLPDDSWPKSTEVQWRLSALARGLCLKLPRPFRAPYIPGITVLIPHYGESIIMGKNELWVDRSGRAVGSGPGARGSSSTVQPENRNVQLISWLEHRYSLEFSAFMSRMSQRSREWHGIGRNWRSYNTEQWLKLCVWASMRNQTLLRTVAGMSLYHNAIDCHHAVQGDHDCLLGRDEVWDPAACFTCLVAMQQYAYFNATQLEHAEWMFNMFPSSLKVAFIDSEDKGAQGETDNVHPGQQRRYFSCLIDRHCAKEPNTNRRKPRFRIELPGFPILGDGKGDNQNTAIPFSRGQFIQCIDANQGAYFEQMLLLPCALGEFRSPAPPTASGQRRATGAPDRNGTKKIVGFPEHITSDIGSIGDFAASAEFAFGTVLQRAHAALGGRMHYGHPDVMAKAFMMQQGGVSKATKTVNLSEDIFAGMDFTLRGGGRSIVHREYLHLTKGRDMGFATVLQFFSKLSAGAGEVVLTRQSLRLGQLMPLPEFLTFYYAHVGFYFTQYFMSRCPPTLMFLWLLVVLSGTEANFQAMDQRTGMLKPTPSNSEAIALLFSQCFSWVVLLFLVAQAMPYIVAVWSQQGILVAIPRYFKQLITLSPLHFVFQAKVIGIYVTNELRVGGAQYIATGRGLPIDRRPFISERGGLYQDFVQIALYDGARLLGCAMLVILMGGAGANLTWWWLCLGLTIVSWLYAPFIFNPYQFAHRFFRGDLQSIKDFFHKDGGSLWEAWYERTQLRRGTGLRVTIFDLIYWFFFISAWYTTVNAKLHVHATLFPTAKFRQLPLLPPIFMSLIAAAVAAGLEPFMGRKRSSQPGAANLLPLSPIAGIFVVLDLAEVAVGLLPLVGVHWWKACGAALILKYCLLSLILNMAEQTLRLDWCRCGYPRALLRLWLYGHRMAMDILVSSLIFCTLAPLVLFDRMRDLLCANCSFHHLLVFRDPGQLARDEAQVLGEMDMRSPLAASRGGDEPALPAGTFAPPLPPPSSAPSRSAVAAAGAGAGVVPADPVSAQPPARPPPQLPSQKAKVPAPRDASSPPSSGVASVGKGAASSAAPPLDTMKAAPQPAAPSAAAASSAQAVPTGGPRASAAAAASPSDLDAFEDDFINAEDVVRLARAAAAPKGAGEQ